MTTVFFFSCLSARIIYLSVCLSPKASVAFVPYVTVEVIGPSNLSLSYSDFMREIHQIHHYFILI